MGGLRLDSREAAIKGGSRGPAIVPGNPADSLLLNAVLHTAGALRMPPGPKLKEPETAALAHWIRMGAPWGSSADTVAKAGHERFWAFVPPKEPVVPAVKNQAWVRTPIDAFVLSALETRGLSPSRPADRRTLIRRATYDLTGLPPTPSQVWQFLEDESPKAFANLVDRLLASPRYGERWGRHWLDVARYADSNGLDENLVYRHAYRYRDYVIHSFNEDKPFDRFLQEQIAGDLLPATDDLKVQFERWTATGFLSLGAKMLAEDDPVKLQMDIVDEQLDTAARAFMGLTVGCARCHDHKFDPISQADYYAMAGIFKSSRTMDNFKVVAKWHEYVLAPKEDRDRLVAHEARIEAKRNEISRIVNFENEKLAAAAMERVGAYLIAASRLQREEKLQPLPIQMSSDAIVRASSSFDNGNVNRTIQKEQTNVPAGAKGPFFAEFVITVPAAGHYQIDVIDQEKGAGTADLWVNGTWMKKGAAPIENRVASPETGGWSYLGTVLLRQGSNTIRLEHARRFPFFERLVIAAPSSGLGPLNTVQIAKLYDLNPGFLDQLVDYLKRSNGAVASVLYAWEIQGTDAPLTDWASPVASLFADASWAATPEAIASRYETLFRQALSEGTSSNDGGIRALYEFLKEQFGPFRAPEDARRYYGVSTRESLAKLEQEAKDLEALTPDLPRAMGVREADKIGDIPIHVRGSHWTLAQTVRRGFLGAISGHSGPSLGPNESGRLQLAQWMTRPDHPLTSRVFVNRIWRGLLGRGIVASVDNFGRLGQAPSNQPLLDWLALRFVEEGWSVKAMHRLIMLSSTYQMSSEYNARAAEEDPENVLLWRMPRRRLEAEAIRDGILSASEALTDMAGGTLLRYKDRQYVADTAKGANHDYERPVRSVYLPVIRSSLYDVFQAFDFPDPTTANGGRDATIVAPQALFMMNSPVMLEHSRKMAKLLLDREINDSHRIHEAYERALSRPPNAQELDSSLSFITRMEREWKGDRVKAWQSFCKALLASNEFLYLD
jgi:hypothetical protein